MKLFFIIPTLKQGGAERIISELVNHFSKHEIEIHLVLLVKSESFYKINSNVTLHRLGFVNKNILQRCFSEFHVFFKLRCLLKKHRPNSVLSFMDKYNIFTILASRFLNLRVFVSDRSNPKLKLQPLLHILKKLTYRHATGVIAQTYLAKEIIEDFTGNKNVEVIPNPVKEIQIYPEVIREKIILNVGRLVPEKGQEYLLQAFHKLNLRDWNLVILGEGPLRKDLEKQILNLGLEGRVILPGSVNNIDKWLAKASVFAFSSISEGFPNALVEAMAAGLPCVSFDCDAGPRDIIQNEINGFLIEKKNHHELADRLSMIITDSKLSERLALEAKKVRQTYNIRTISKKYFDFLLK